MEWIESGVNLCAKAFAEDRNAVIERAFQAGVQQIVITGTDITTSECGAELCEIYPQQLFHTAGLHPHHARDWNQSTETFIGTQATHSNCVALGETGLDFFRNLSSSEDQIRSFEAQLGLAAELQKPLFLHQRDAHQTFIKILRKHRHRLGRLVVHCFTDNEDALRDIVALDCYVGITGWICDPLRGQHLHRLLPLIPAERLLLETDAPYLFPHGAPAPLIKRRNEPHYLPWIGRYIANLLHCDVEQLAAQSSANARRFFALPSLTQD